MQFRLVEVAESGRFVSKDRGFLVLSVGSDELGRLPLDDVGVLLISSPHVTITTPVLNALLERKSVVIFCDNRFNPSGILWPTQFYYHQTKRLFNQVNASLPLKKRVWQLLVKSKIKNQGLTLKNFKENDQGLIPFSERVGSGDPENMEGQAAQRYWPALFGNDFRRDPNGAAPNALLNYGYAILRSAVARAIISSGLNPSFGVHHSNFENPFCLVDDMMEPYRPIIDLAVMNLCLNHCMEVTPDSKKTLVDILNFPIKTQNGWVALSQHVILLAQQYATSIENGRVKLYLPMVEI